MLGLALVPFVVATVAGLVWLWPRHATVATHPLGKATPLVNATVSSARVTPCATGPGVCQDVAIRVTSGPDAGRTVALPQTQLGPGVTTVKGGERIVAGRVVDPASGHVYYYFADFQRGVPLIVLSLLFAAAVVGVARWRGLAALVGLGVAWLVLVRFALPDILDGRSPVAVALVASAAIMIPVLYLAHGLNARSTTALLGTLVSLALTGLLAAVFVAATHLSGLASEESTYLTSLAGKVSWSGLMLAGVVIGSLGALNDVTVTQASATWELHDANPDRPPARLYQAGMRIGRDHIASSVYTLVLAYAGATLPLLILFALAGQPFHAVVTGETVAEELVRTLVGSIGLVASVPITTALAALIVTRAGSNEMVPVRGRAPRLPEPGTGRFRRKRAKPASPAAEGAPGWTPPRRERDFWDADSDREPRPGAF